MTHIGGLVVRGAREQDYDKLDRMFRKYARYDQDRFLFKILEQTEPIAIRVATFAGQVVGCAYGHNHGEGVGVVAGLFMAKPFANAQVAEALLRGCVQSLRDRGCTDIVSMIGENETLRKSYDNLGFEEWQRKAWTFVELSEGISLQFGAERTAAEIGSEEDVLRLLDGQDLIPYRFWYRRASQELVRRACRSGQALVVDTDKGPSAALWEDLPALEVQQPRHTSYFLFSQNCSDLSDVGESIEVREISFVRGPRPQQLIRRVMNDAYEKGVRVILLHLDAADVLGLMDTNLRFSTPRIILRSSLGISLDSFLNTPEAIMK